MTNRKYFMIDIEATGIEPEKEELLQIGLLEVNFREGFWHPGRKLELLQKTDRVPENEFSKVHMAELYERCRQLKQRIPPEHVQNILVDFFVNCGATKQCDTFLMGWNASNFDIPFLAYHKYLETSHYETIDGKDVMVGDVHYRVYEIGGAICLAQDVLGIDNREMLLETARAAAPNLFEMPKGKEHDAIYDCFQQLKLLNGLIALTRGNK